MGNPSSLFALALTLIVASPSIAGVNVDIAVTDLDDGSDPANGTCTLREAIITANTNSPVDACIPVPNALTTDRILLPPAPVSLSLVGPGEDLAATGDLDIYQPVEIVGVPGSSAITWPGAADRSFHVQAGAGSVRFSDFSIQASSAIVVPDDMGAAIFNQGTLHLNDMTIMNNTALNAGGGILNVGTMTMTRGALANNSAVVDDPLCIFGGGAIYNTGSATFTDVVFENNHASDFFIGGPTIGSCGGAIFNDIGGSLWTVRSTVTDCSAYQSGGGINNRGGYSSDSDSFIRNLAQLGGAILNTANDLRVSNSTFANNEASLEGDAVFSSGDGAHFTNTTFSRNSGSVNTGQFINTGGTNSEPVVMMNVTMYTDEVSGVNVNNSGIIEIGRTILDSQNGSNCLNTGTLRSRWRNIDNNGTCPPLSPATEDFIGPTGISTFLDSNGGPTDTHSLLPGSEAIDEGASCPDPFGVPMESDQRGIPRPIYADCDIGAFEAALLINEVDADTPSVPINDSLEFVELYDSGIGLQPLDGLSLVFFNGSTDTSYAALDLDGFATDGSGFFLTGNPSVVPVPTLIFPDGTLQNGADAVALFVGDGSDFPNGTAVTTTGLVDAVVYDTDDSDDPGLLILLEGGQNQVNEAGAGNAEFRSIQRCPDGSGGPRRTFTFSQYTPNPGSTNLCQNSIFGDGFESGDLTAWSSSAP